MVSIMIKLFISNTFLEHPRNQNLARIVLPNNHTESTINMCASEQPYEIETNICQSLCLYFKSGNKILKSNNSRHQRIYAIT